MFCFPITTNEFPYSVIDGGGGIGSGIRTNNNNSNIKFHPSTSSTSNNSLLRSNNHNNNNEVKVESIKIQKIEPIGSLFTGNNSNGIFLTTNNNNEVIATNDSQPQQIFISQIYPSVSNSNPLISAANNNNSIPTISFPLSLTSTTSTADTNYRFNSLSNKVQETIEIDTNEHNNMPTLGIVFNHQDQPIPMLITTGSSATLQHSASRKVNNATSNTRNVPSNQNTAVTANAVQNNHNQQFNVTAKGDQAICPKCNKIFANKYTLKTHQRTHLGIKEFKCEICEKCFSQKVNLMYHLKTHSGEKGFVCPICQRCFTQLGNCRAHCSKKHGIEIEKKRKGKKNDNNDSPENGSKASPSSSSSSHTTSRGNNGGGSSIFGNGGGGSSNNNHGPTTSHLLNSAAGAMNMNKMNIIM